jgi:hypothetical protein
MILLPLAHMENLTLGLVLDVCTPAMRLEVVGIHDALDNGKHNHREGIIRQALADNNGRKALRGA